MKHIIIAFFLLSGITNLFATELFSIKLKNNEKLEGSYSAKIQNNQSSHFLIVKNSDTKKYILKPYILDENKKVKPLNELSFDEAPSIIANHSDENNITLSNYDEKNKTLFIIDFDLKTGKNSQKTIEKIEKPDLVFNENNKTLLINYIKNGEKLDVKTITSTSNIINSVIETPKELQKEFKSIIKSNPDAINQNEFVENSSIKNTRAYFIDNKILFTNQDSNEFDQFSIDLKDANNFKKASIDLAFDKRIKDVNAYVYGEKLVAVGSNKEDVILKFFDLDNGKVLQKFSLQNDLKKYLANSDFNTFLDESKKSNLKTTVTLNKTKSNKTKVRLDRVNKSTYNYNYNWWWHNQWFMQQQMMQQQMMMRRQMMQNTQMRGFGPNYVENFTVLKEIKYQSLEFILDDNFSISKSENEETNYINHNKDSILKEFEDNKNVKEFSCTFFDNELRYIYQDKKSKTVYINFKAI
jgi:hypothetical protein